MMKKILFSFLLMLLAVITAFFIWRYAGYVCDKDPDKTFLLPRLELSLVEINSLTDEKIEITAKMLVKNQLPISFTADSLQYAGFINNIEIVQNRYPKSITLKGNDTSWILLPVTIFKHNIDSILKSNERKNIDSAEYRFKGYFYAGKFLRKKINIDIRRLLPLVYIPEVKAGSMEIDSLNFSRAAIRLHISMENKNAFPLETKNVAYEFSIEGNEWIRGTIPGLMDIKAEGITELIIPVRISFKEMRKTLFGLLRKGGNVNYKLRLSFIAESDHNVMRNSKVILSSSGSVKSLLKAARKIN